MLMFSLVVLALLAVLYLFRRPILGRIGKFLVSDNGDLSASDLVILLNGNISTRPFRVVELFKEKQLPVVFARLADTQEVRMGVIPNISEATRNLMIKSGVPEEHIHLLKSNRWIASTWEEAIMICEFMAQNGYTRALIVTDSFHTRRARWTFRKVMGDPGVSFECVPTALSMSMMKGWWRSEYAMIQVFQEYIKFLHYQWRWHVASKKRRPGESDLLLAKDVRPLVCGRKAD